MRPIDADALKEQFREGAYTVKGIREEIDNAPTVDTTCPNCDSGYAQEYSDGYLKGKEERPQGEWLIIDDTEQFIAKCSVCGRIEDSRMVKDYPFCPNCGADMRGGRE